MPILKEWIEVFYEGKPLEEVAAKIQRHSEALGGISRFSFQMDVGLSHQQLLASIEHIGKEVSPLING